MQEKPLISICIPTYNRCIQLKKVIESIISQEEFQSGKVEVVISDNASEDETENIGRKYAHRYENISYFRNEQNVKDRNYPLVLGKAKGIFRKLNNDTVVWKPGALKEICDVVMQFKDEQPVIFFTNGNAKRCKEGHKSFREFALEISFHMTWIASFGIWEKDCCNISEDFAGCELQLWQTKKLLEMADKKNDVYVYHKKYANVLSVEKKDISYGLYKVFYQNYMSLLMPCAERERLTGNDIEYLEKDLLYRFFTGWVIRWELQDNHLQYSSEENLKEKVFEQYRHKEYWKRYYVIYQIKLLVYKMKRILCKG